MSSQCIPMSQAKKLMYWITGERTVENILSNIANIVRRLLAAVPSSTPTERVFSSSG